MDMNTLKRAIIVVSFAIIAIWAFLFLQGRHEMARRVHQVKDILLASKLYSLDHSGRMPGAFDELASLRSKWDGHIYYDRTSWSGGFLQRASRELEFVSSDATDKADPFLVVVRERSPDSHGRRIVGYGDMSTRIVQENH